MFWVGVFFKDKNNKSWIDRVDNRDGEDNNYTKE